MEQNRITAVNILVQKEDGGESTADQGDPWALTCRVPGPREGSAP